MFCLNLKRFKNIFQNIQALQKRVDVAISDLDSVKTFASESQKRFGFSEKQFDSGRFVERGGEGLVGEVEKQVGHQTVAVSRNRNLPQNKFGMTRKIVRRFGIREKTDRRIEFWNR